MDSLLTVAACDFCDLREELTMFFTTLIAMKHMMKCHAVFQDQLHFHPDPGWRAPPDLRVTQTVSLPIDSECRMPAASPLPDWVSVTIVITLVTGQRCTCRLHKPLGGFSRKIEELLELRASLTFFP